MARIKTKGRIVAVAILLAIATILITRFFSDSGGQGRLRLPVGKVTPAICLGETHGLILASDGSLWSWGSDFLGWPVLGLGELETNYARLHQIDGYGIPETKSTSLRRIGNETNWVSVSASASRNLAVKSDGTLWTWGESVQARFVPPTPMIIAPVPAAPGSDWKQAAAGGNIFAALKKDGTLWAWGNNWAGSAGIASTNGSSAPVQVGSATNWIKVWAGLLETVAMQSDGSLWYWGENPSPTFAQGVNQIWAPTRVSPDTNWVDAGFGVNTVLAIKSDGTLWAWGRQAHVLSGSNDQTQDATPVRIGTNCDWQSICASTGWWCKGLTKKDGSLWFMDASGGNPNSPPTPYQPVQFRRVEFQKEYVAYAAGAVHAAAPGVHGPIGVVLTGDGEVWTWGMVLGDPPSLKSRAGELALKFTNTFHFKMRPVHPDPIFREKPWQLRNVKPDDAAH